VKILFYKGEPIGIDIPFFIDLKIVRNRAGVPGTTVSGSTKPRGWSPARLCRFLLS